MEIYYKINLDILQNFNSEKINYQILQNINGINQNINLENLDEIINENNFYSRFEKIIDIYDQMNNINEDNEEEEEQEQEEQEQQEEEIDTQNHNNNSNIIQNNTSENNLNNYLLSDQELRDKYITHNLSNEYKMKIYNAIINENLELIEQIVNQDNVFEELSSPNDYWTGFHYAFHYGKWKIIEFLSEFLKSKNLFDISLKLKNKNGRCPLLCLLKSNLISIYTKKDIYKSFIEEFAPPISEEVQEELIRSNFL